MYQRENLVGLDHAPKLGPHALKGGLDVVVPDNKIDLQIIKPGMICTYVLVDGCEHK